MRHPHWLSLSLSLSLCAPTLWLAGCSAPCDDGYAKANDGQCYPVESEGDDDDDDDDDDGGRRPMTADPVTDVTRPDTTIDTTTDVGTTGGIGDIGILEFAEVSCDGDELVLMAVTVGIVDEVVFDILTDDAREWHPLASSQAWAMSIGDNGLGETTWRLPGGGWSLGEQSGLCPDALGSAPVALMARTYVDGQLGSCFVQGDADALLLAMEKGGGHLEDHAWACL